MSEIKAPESGSGYGGAPFVFLAGSIEMGAAVDWQREMANLLSPEDCNVMNPRRDDWDASWTQEVSNDQFLEQVSWELYWLERSDLVVMYFVPGTQSPITLLELGLFAQSGKLIVCCPEGFWRKGNVDIVCARYGVRTAETLDELKTVAYNYVRTHA